jgi:tetratricopeptide (TPR) repeat protein
MPEDEVAVAAAARICADLDGLPLAIELAAARVTALSLDEIADRLADRFRFLVSWRRLSPARHRTLREAMDWSFELLSSDERELLAGMSVFAGHFTLDAVARVCTDADEERALAGIERLIAASLVLTEEQDGTMRYRLLETVRQYAGEQLAGEAALQVRRAHAHYYLGVAERADLTAVSRGAGQRLEIAIRAQDNLRGALAWAIESGSVAFGLELATSLERFWAIHDARQGMSWFTALFARPEASDVAPTVRANALRAYGGAADIAGEDDTARRLWEESLAIFRELDDESGQAVLLHRLAISAQRRGDLVGARELVDASHHIHERSGNRWGQAQTLGTLGAIARDGGDEQRAFELLGASLELAREARVTWWVSGTLAELANLDLNAGRIHEAAGRARESLALADRMADRAGRAFGVGLLARVAFESADHELARHLWIAVEGEDAGAPLGGWRHHRESYRRRLAGLLPASEHGTAGERPTLEEAVSLALTGAPSDEPARPAAQT